LRAESQALEVAAHNLANLNTSGFRGQQTTFQSLIATSGPTAPSPLDNMLNAVLNRATNNYGVLEGSHMDMTAGNVVTTSNPLDVAIEGSGFFGVQTAAGTRYTRNGGFRVSSSGRLVTAEGDQVMSDPSLGDKDKGITVPKGVVSIASDGTLSVNGAVAGTIGLVDFLPGTPLVSEGGSLIAAPDGATIAAQQSQMKQGALESSNVNSVSSVVTLIAVQRQAEMLQRCMSMFDTELNQIASTQLAKI
jgi:flagellar basal-body rod protein FlgF/flagellar basal-body rod protein FlgG